MLKIVKLTLPKSNGVDNTLGQDLSLPSFSSEDLWKSEPLGFKTRNRQSRSTINNINIFVFDVWFRPVSVSLRESSLRTRYFGNPTGLSSPVSTTTFSSGALEACWRTPISVPAAPTIDSVSAWDVLISSSRIIFSSAIASTNKNWLSFDRFTCFIHQTLNFDEFDGQ